MGPGGGLSGENKKVPFSQNTLRHETVLEITPLNGAGSRAWPGQPHTVPSLYHYTWCPEGACRRPKSELLEGPCSPSPRWAARSDPLDCPLPLFQAASLDLQQQLWAHPSPHMARCIWGCPGRGAVSSPPPRSQGCRLRQRAREPAPGVPGSSPGSAAYPAGNLEQAARFSEQQRPGSPSPAGALQRRQVEAPEAQRGGHGKEHGQPAAGHNERHEEPEVVHGRDLEAGRGGAAQAQAPLWPGMLRNPRLLQTEAGRGGQGCWTPAWAQGTTRSCSTAARMHSPHPDQRWGSWVGVT